MGKYKLEVLISVFNLFIQTLAPLAPLRQLRQIAKKWCFSAVLLNWRNAAKYPKVVVFILFYYIGKMAQVAQVAQSNIWICKYILKERPLFCCFLISPFYGSFPKASSFRLMYKKTRHTQKCNPIAKHSQYLCRCKKQKTSN